MLTQTAAAAFPSQHTHDSLQVNVCGFLRLDTALSEVHSQHFCVEEGFPAVFLIKKINEAYSNFSYSLNMQPSMFKTQRHNAV